jgi:hypothetical protein
MDDDIHITRDSHIMLDRSKDAWYVTSLGTILSICRYSHTPPDIDLDQSSDIDVDMRGAPIQCGLFALTTRRFVQPTDVMLAQSDNTHDMDVSGAQISHVLFAH